MTDRRALIKWLHWLSLALILYFFAVEPDENTKDPGGALSTHAGVGLMLALVVALWFSIYLLKGLASRPGPKLPALGKRIHPLMHKALYIVLPVMVLSGAFAGFMAPFAIKAFGWLQINPAFGSKNLHELAQDLHELVFNATLTLIVFHALFHLWRHFWLKDNSLRIMVPKLLHKYL